MRIAKAHITIVIAILFSTAMPRIVHAQGTVTVTSVSDTLLCAGDSITVLYTTTGTFYSGNVFRVQLSDTSGSFTSGNQIVIGGIQSTGPSSINCTIPTSAMPGTNYRLRIFADSLTYFSPPYSKPLRIDVYPIALATNNGPVCEGDSLTIASAFNDPGVSYFWSGPIVFSKPDTTFKNITLSLAGTYKLTATRGACHGQDFTSVVVNPLPNKPVISSPSKLCQGDSLQFSIVQTSGAQYGWSGPDTIVNPTSPNPTLYYLNFGNTGPYTVEAKFPGTGCFDRDTQVIAVDPAPNKPLSSLLDTPVCSGKALAFIVNNTTAGATYLWTGPGLTTFGTNPVFNNITVANSGNYVVEATLGSCTASDTVAVVVNPTPVIQGAAADDICTGDSLILIATSLVTGTYHWFDTSGFSTTGTSGTAIRPDAIIDFAHRYFVSLTSVAGCVSDTLAVTAVIIESPQVPTLTNNSPVCSGDNLALSALSTTPGVSYSWSGPNGFSFSNQDILLPALANMSGTYTVTVSLGQCTSSAKTDVEVKPYNTPGVTISADPGIQVSKMTPIVFKANAINAGAAPQYQWRKNGVDIPGAINEMYSAVAGVDVADNDFIAVRIISNAECPLPDSIVSYVFTVDVKTDVDDINVVNNLSIYPNPSHGSFNIKGSINADGPIEMRVINAAGDIVYKGTAITTAKTIDFPVSLGGLSSGIYLLQLKAGEQMINLRFSVGN